MRGTAASRRDKRPLNGGITMATPLKPWGPLSLRLQFTLTQWVPRLKGLAPFQSVFFSRWVVLTSIPYNGPPQVRERPQPWLLWEVVYSADVDPYIESFALGIRTEIDRVWGSSYRFPKRGSVAALRRYIDAMRFEEGYTYWAYPAASVRMVLAALEIAREHAFLAQVASSGDDRRFAEAYRAFLCRRGADL